MTEWVTYEAVAPEPPEPPPGSSTTSEHDTGDENDWTWPRHIAAFTFKRGPTFVVYHPIVLGLHWVREYEANDGFDDVNDFWRLRRIADGSLATEEERALVRGRYIE